MAYYMTKEREEIRVYEKVEFRYIRI